MKTLIWFNECPDFENLFELTGKYHIVRGVKPNGDFGYAVCIELTPNGKIN